MHQPKRKIIGRQKAHRTKNVWIKYLFLGLDCSMWIVKFFTANESVTFDQGKKWIREKKIKVTVVGLFSHRFMKASSTLQRRIMISMRLTTKDICIKYEREYCDIWMRNRCKCIITINSRTINRNYRGAYLLLGRKKINGWKMIRA